MNKVHNVLFVSLLTKSNFLGNGLGCHLVAKPWNYSPIQSVMVPQHYIECIRPAVASAIVEMRMSNIC